jgi:hypothetical protein
VVLDDIIHGHLEEFYYLNFLSIYFVFYKAEKVDPRGVELRGEQKKKPTRYVAHMPRYAPQNSNICRVTTVAHGICATEAKKVAPKKRDFLVVMSICSSHLVLSLE